jgi:hypothetical protein
VREFTLGEPIFMRASDVRDYCQNGRTLIRPLANELRISAEELNAALREARGHPALLGVDTKLKARLVARHLVNAAEGVEMACGELIRTFLSLEKHFLAPANATATMTRRRQFDLHS